LRPVNSNIFGFLGRFTLLHVIVYTVMATIFLNIQRLLPVAKRTALDFFQPYQFDVTGIITQIIIGAVMALVLYPFYDIIVKKERGWLILLAALWGIALLGSLEPKPGSIEGMIYTETTLLEHFLVIATGAIQSVLFSWLFLHWERGSASATEKGDSIIKDVPDIENSTSKNIRSYVGRYTLLHMIIYLIVGMVFYQVSGYEEALDTMEYFELWRDMENMTMPFVVLLGQIVRGGILALLLYPFYNTYMEKRHGWLLLFGLLFGLKVLATVIVVPSTLLEFAQALGESMAGLPEILVQTLVFAWLFFFWEKRRAKKALKESVSS
jgi:hypothetical protein